MELTNSCADQLNNKIDQDSIVNNNESPIENFDQEFENVVENNQLFSTLEQKPAQTIQSKKTKKKKKKSSLDAPDEDDAILDASIAFNKEQELKSLALENSSSANYSTVTLTHDSAAFEQTQQFLAFAQMRQDKIEEREAQRKKGLTEINKKLCRVKAENRDDERKKLQQKLSIEFPIIDTHEQQAIKFLDWYACQVLTTNSIDDLSVQKFTELEKNLQTQINRLLTSQGVHLKWYLLLYPPLHENIKSKYIALKAALQTPSSGKREIAFMEKDSSLDTTSDQNKILAILKRIHTRNGMLDITRILYQMPSLESINRLATLSNDQLTQAENAIKAQYDPAMSIDDLYFIQEIINTLLKQAGFSPGIKGMTNDIIIFTKTLQDDSYCDSRESLLDEVASKIFYSLQIDNEMNSTHITDEQKANLSKIYATVSSTLIKLIISSKK
ncbi:hypothetical protein C0J27_04740 [Candidatus Chromulinivorax destructor]|uniref:Uncharacterized protein n=2 Tax=Candidatus Chromulinivorax destructor TaxID=2066483 RepID=A0A345ZCJ4_9BACT|nr:hypothetical protein C0J27_04740 [Candidatus Chromulinivorax destructor]